MEEIEVRLFATLQEGRFKKTKIRADEVRTVGDILDHFKIDPEEVAIVFVNRKHASLDTEIRAGDTVSLFPKVGGG